ncbi:hypothetical protein HYPSUDRAFT_202484 [Hypholoma sublateritium FD-334 SS-4]|uniref:Uncharacterized protein n=1 Tax=Hypholoma sublateritium (strain FD-334 SS-4) TaxID=945553 RepID=A0A0D2PQ02_HYPSF|nr:hypothetical protein HYPSUDRAFT_202484 [Hypholoma sublateritium FD-334 SS-4]
MLPLLDSHPSKPSCLLMVLFATIEGDPMHLVDEGHALISRFGGDERHALESELENAAVMIDSRKVKDGKRLIGKSHKLMEQITTDTEDVTEEVALEMYLAQERLTELTNENAG